MDAIYTGEANVKPSKLRLVTILRRSTGMGLVDAVQTVELMLKNVDISITTHFLPSELDAMELRRQSLVVQHKLE